MYATYNNNKKRCRHERTVQTESWDVIQNQEQCYSVTTSPSMTYVCGRGMLGLPTSIGVLFEIMIN